MRLGDYIRIMRKKCEWLEGFAAALGNAALATFTYNIREMLNRLESAKAQHIVDEAEEAANAAAESS
jgi:hypothetical protein